VVAPVRYPMTLQENSRQAKATGQRTMHHTYYSFLVVITAFPGKVTETVLFKPA
jgi:hypothetical protein